MIDIHDTQSDKLPVVLTDDYERYYAVSQRMDALIEEYLDAQALTAA